MCVRVEQCVPGSLKTCLHALDSVASPPVRDVGMNSPALVPPGSSPAAPRSETAVFNRTNGKYSS